MRHLSLQREGGDSRGGCQGFSRDSIRVLVRDEVIWNFQRVIVTEKYQTIICQSNSVDTCMR